MTIRRLTFGPKLLLVLCLTLAFHPCSDLTGLPRCIPERIAGQADVCESMRAQGTCAQSGFQVRDPQGECCADGLRVWPHHQWQVSRKCAE
jgi:hypothetical protein